MCQMNKNEQTNKNNRHEQKRTSALQMCDLPFDAMIIMGDAEISTIQTLWLAKRRSKTPYATSVVVKWEHINESSEKLQRKGDIEYL